MQKLNVAPGPFVWPRPETSVVPLDDRAADRQADAHALGLGGVEGVEQLFDGCGSMPVPESRTASLTLPSSSQPRPTSSVLGRSSTSAMASAAFSSRFRITCCSWTRSTLT